MKFETMTDENLLNYSREKAKNERQMTLDMIEAIREVYKRKLHFKRGYGSLHQFCVKEYRYSDGAAHRRIKAMRLSEELPEVVKSIESGSLNLCTASQLQVAFENRVKELKIKPSNFSSTQNPALNTEMKLSFLAQVENKSRREAEKVIVEISPKVVKREEKVTRINSQQIKLELVIEEELFKKLEKLKSLTSHKNKNFKNLLNDLADEALLRKDPELKMLKKTPTRASPVAVTRVKKRTTKANSQPGPKDSRYIPAVVRQEVWMRDKGRCTYFDSKSKRQCNSSHLLQFEHIVPYSYGGSSTIDNLRLLCANHNKLTAEKIGGWKQ